MNSFLIFIYFTLFAVIAGGAFAMMWANIQSINEEMRRPKKPQHPEALANKYLNEVLDKIEEYRV